MSEYSASISTSELRAALNAIVDHLESTHGSTLSVPVEYFWSIPAPDLYDVEVKPPVESIGQVSESWDNVKALRAGNNDDTISYSSVWLGEVLTAIGHTYVR